MAADLERERMKAEERKRKHAGGQSEGGDEQHC